MMNAKLGSRQRGDDVDIRDRVGERALPPFANLDPGARCERQEEQRQERRNGQPQQGFVLFETPIGRVRVRSRHPQNRTRACGNARGRCPRHAISSGILVVLIRKDVPHLSESLSIKSRTRDLSSRDSALVNKIFPHRCRIRRRRADMRGESASDSRPCDCSLIRACGGRCRLRRATGRPCRRSTADACSAWLRRPLSIIRHELNAVRRRAASCGLSRSTRRMVVGNEAVAGAVGSVELRLVHHGEASDERAHAVRIAQREGRMLEQRLDARQGRRFFDRGLEGEPLVEHQGFVAIALAEMRERLLARVAGDASSACRGLRADPSCWSALVELRARQVLRRQPDRRRPGGRARRCAERVARRSPHPGCRRRTSARSS